MQKQLLSLLLLVFTTLVSSQIKGNITDQNNDPLPFVNILIENTYKGTTSNDDGYYELNISTPKTYTIVFSYLGYKTVKQEVNITKFPYQLDMSLVEESVSLNEVVVDSENDPANDIMRQAIANREANLAKIESFKADFYSRGLLKIVDAPKKIMGQDVGDLGGALDSTRSGIIYLSETISKIQFLNPDKLKEKITASKVSGDSNGFSFNSALDVDYNFYKNTISLGNEIISPIANNAFGYYKYKLEGMFYDDRGNLINKIKVIPKRKNDPVFSGFIYIVEDQWDIYAVELDISGPQAKIPMVDIISLQQSFSYSETNDIWAVISQSMDLKYALLGIKGEGRFTAVYSNYEFNTGLTRKDFTREIVSYEKEANKKDSLFWNAIRPVPLTNEERIDYIKKDSIQTLRESKPYLDSIDAVRNKFKIGNVLGYTYQNSHKDYSLGFNIPILNAVQFNTVQGYTANANVFYSKNYDDYNRYFRVNGDIQYGFSDDRLRAKGSLIYKFNSVSNSFIMLSGGVSAEQFSPFAPIKPIINSVSTLFFEDNYIKLYDKSFVALNYSEELFNGFRLYAGLSYERRKALFNTTDQTFYNDENDAYTSNNPLNEIAFGIAPFQTHNIIKANVDTRINFGQEYLSYPDAKYNVSNDDYPTLYLGYETGFGATNSDYDFSQIKASLTQGFNVKDKGRLIYNLKAGTFFNAENIAFMDYQHFNGNLTHVSTEGNYTNVFNNLDYYSASTNDTYFEGHIEHDFNGFILGKLPLLNKLNFNLVVGAHLLAKPDFKPYQEYSIGIDNIGWGKWKFLRVDYLRSYQSGFQSDAIVFGLKFF
ncbi:carboxypeptidase-like regulatory domain-containing protein [Winogradskyella sp. PAMC22761]|nr:carboxypeptidase-like regulatory domain-containing protein [Winogradskyella sp. PAMC22761]